MSIQAIAWVFSQNIRPSTSKFVLVALANFLQEDSTAWCAISTISEITSQDRKTVLRALADLEQQGHVTDSGQRKGYTGQIKVYQVRVPDAVLLRMPKESRSSRKESRSSRQRVPYTGHNPYKLSVNIHSEQKSCNCGVTTTSSDGICGVCRTKKYIQNLGTRKT